MSTNSLSAKSPFILVTCLFLVLGLILSGCELGFGGGGEPVATTPVDLDIALTQAAETLAAETPQSPPPTETEAEMPATPTEAAEQAPTATSVLQPTDTPVPTATFTPRPPTNTSPPPTTALPSATPTEAIVFQEAFFDDFSEPSGWFTQKNDNYGFEFAKGGFRLYSNIPDAIWNVRGDFSDVSVEVETVKQIGGEGSYFGVVCRHIDGGNYYALVINTDGFYGIAKRGVGQLQFLEQGTAPQGLINPGGGPNIIRGDCIAGTMSLYVNDQFIAEAQDNDLGAGAVGLIVGNQLDKQTIDVVFDNFAVFVP